MIGVENLTKRYGDRTAVDGVSFNVKKGEVLGFLGPNGAGKSTTMRMITGFLSPSAGRVTIGGLDMAKDPLKAKALIGYLPESVPLYPEMTVRDYLRFVGLLKGIPRSEVNQRVGAVIERCWLTTYADRLISHLSKGYRQRCGLAQALIHNPPILIMDEPTSGLDPKQILETRDLIRSLRGDHSVILSTHILPEVQDVCDRVLIINQGKLIADESPDQLETKLRGGGQSVHIEAKGPIAEMSARLGAVAGVKSVKSEPKGLEFPDSYEFVIETEPGDEVRKELAAAIVSGGWELLEIRTA
ncbi:MAG: ABC transporter ATP-binding protein, partial [Cyanobacteria bacterium REEB65]|nr:ABC transporter ATP-binding protein [Cyanobacteria bacterium REEB65]